MKMVEIKEDIGQRVIDKLDELNLMIDKTHSTVRKKIEGKKNSHLHMMLETSLMNKIEKEAKDQNVSIAELVRRKLRGDSQLDRIEDKIDNLNPLHKNNNH